MSRCTGWLLSFSGGAQAVIGQRELLHLVERPELHEVPCAPAHGRQVLPWREDVLPVIDLGVWSDRDAPGTQDPVVAIVGFLADTDTAPAFGALKLTATPRRIEVDDAWACALPPPLARWRRIACACFETGAEALPILDLARLFRLDLNGAERPQADPRTRIEPQRGISSSTPTLAIRPSSPPSGATVRRTSQRPSPSRQELTDSL